MHATSKATENSFNAVRLLAAVQVAYMHAIAHLNIPPIWGHEWISQFPGVPIFFSVSGYLVFDSMLRLGSLKHFVAHRAARIYPALAVNILLMEAALYATGQIEFTRVPAALWAFLFFVCYTFTASYNIAALWVGSGGGTLSFDGFFQIYPSGVLWTLTVELTFYVAVALAVLARGRAAQTLLIVVASIASFAFQKFLGADATKFTVTITVVPYFWMFGIGMLLRLWLPTSRSIKYSAAIALTTYVMVEWWRQLPGFEWKIDPGLGDAIQAILLCLLAVLVGLSPFLKSRILAQSDVSYGMYLYHMLIVTALMNVSQEERSRWLLIIVMVGSALFGFLSWHLIERPAINLARSKRLSGQLIGQPAS